MSEQVAIGRKRIRDNNKKGRNVKRFKLKARKNSCKKGREMMRKEK